MRDDLDASVVRAAVDDRRLHPGAGLPADARRLDRRPDRPPHGLPGRPGRSSRAGSLLCSARPEPRLADRVPDGAGGRRLDAQPGRHVDHHQHLHRPARTGPGHRRVGRRGRHLAWRSARWSAALLVDSVGWRSIFWINVPVGLAALVLTARLRPRVPRRRGRAALDPVGQLLVIAPAGLADVRDHRGARARAGRSPLILGCVAVAAAALVALLLLRAAPRRAADRPAVLPQRAVQRRHRDRGRAPSPRSAASSSSTRSTCRTCAASSPLHAGLYMLPMAGDDRWSARRSPGGWSAPAGPRLPLVIGGRRR